MEQDLKFSAALVRLIAGDEIARAGYAANECLRLVEGTIMRTTSEDDKRFDEAYAPTQVDLLASDWKVTKEAE